MSACQRFSLFLTGWIDLSVDSADGSVAVNTPFATELRRKGWGTALAFVGFMLSPLSWWNDLVVNVPLALAFAWLVSWFYRGAFAASFILGYWLTNVLGLVLMHR